MKLVWRFAKIIPIPFLSNDEIRPARQYVALCGKGFRLKIVT